MTLKTSSEISSLSYANKVVFERLLREGFTQAAYGRGDWIENRRIVRLWVLYHPNGRVATIQHPKVRDDIGSMNMQAIEAEYSVQEFDRYIDEWRITLRNQGCLRELLARWDTAASPGKFAHMQVVQ